ncbi:hypothetical protein LSAT2_027090 [Lamellibrachia satsuma]|nr:hypothetical protein LSAT2_027090 [Lamellibrachia satsuma]
MADRSSRCMTYCLVRCSVLAVSGPTRAYPSVVSAVDVACLCGCRAHCSAARASCSDCQSAPLQPQQHYRHSTAGRGDAHRRLMDRPTEVDEAATRLRMVLPTFCDCHQAVSGQTRR